MTRTALLIPSSIIAILSNTEALRWQASDPGWARTSIEERLAGVQLSLHSWWSFDVPEIFTSPQDLYAWRAWGSSPDEVPAYAEAAPDLERIFQQYAGPKGLEIRRRRYMWKAVIPGEERVKRHS